MRGHSNIVKYQFTNIALIRFHCNQIYTFRNNVTKKLKYNNFQQLFLTIMMKPSHDTYVHVYETTITGTDDKNSKLN